MKERLQLLTGCGRLGGGRQQEGRIKKDKNLQKMEVGPLSAAGPLVTVPGEGREACVCVCAFAEAGGVCAALVGHSDHIWPFLRDACLAGPVLAFGVCLCRLGKAENADTRS